VTEIAIAPSGYIGYESGMARLFTEEEVRQMVAETVAKAVAPLKARIAELEAENARLKKNSTNSS
jgi:dihydroorotase-like cyclic amidohydrolase